MVELAIEQDIRAWALTRPAWQQDVLVALSRGETYNAPETIAELADRILELNSSKPNTAVQNLTLGADEPKRVGLKGICNVKGVNALATDQTLPYGPDGLTIIYGNNGSGKSGYARIIKAMVSARHLSLVLPDVYQDGAPDPSAELEYSVDDQALSEKFPSDPPAPDLQRVRFYDEQCGDEYLSHESSVTYRPSALTLLDGLIAVCGKVREELQRRMAESNQKRLNLVVPQGTRADAFLGRLSINTTDQQIDEARQSPETVETRFCRLLSFVGSSAGAAEASPAAGVKAGRRPPGGLGLEAGEDGVTLVCAEDRIVHAAFSSAVVSGLEASRSSS